MRRRAGERVTIGDAIEIEVLEVYGSRVKLGILAPDSMGITYKEAQLTLAENITAATSMDPQVIDTLLRKLSDNADGTVRRQKCDVVKQMRRHRNAGEKNREKK